MKDTLEALSRVVTIDLCCSAPSQHTLSKGKRRVIRSCGYRAYYEAWFVWWFRFGSRRGERSRLESRLSRSARSDGWLDSGGPYSGIKSGETQSPVAKDSWSQCFLLRRSASHPPLPVLTCSTSSPRLQLPRRCRRRSRPPLRLLLNPPLLLPPPSRHSSTVGDHVRSPGTTHSAVAPEGG
jgi:hypothetical protein